MREVYIQNRITSYNVCYTKLLRQFLEKHEITRLLNKYCRFLPVEVAFGKKTEWKDGKEVELEEDNVINETNP